MRGHQFSEEPTVSVIT